MQSAQLQCTTSRGEIARDELMALFDERLIVPPRLVDPTTDPLEDFTTGRAAGGEIESD
jgi:hypothetical protein